VRPGLVIGRWSGRDDTLIQLEGHGREALFDALDLTRTVGWFTSLFPVRLGRCEALGSNLRLVKEQLRAIPDKGLGWGALRYLGDESVQAELAALPVPRITFNYLGQFDGSFAAEDGALFVPAGEAVGPDQSPLAALGNWLTLNGQVYGGEFSMGWRFSTQMFDEATVQRLADDYGRELEALVEHCCTLQSARRRRRTSRWPAWTWRGWTACRCPWRRSRTSTRCRRCSRACCSTPRTAAAPTYINQISVPVQGSTCRASRRPGTR
jgi:non-ribosomal peptide synthase protein (TIGR01720 family)